MGNVEVYKRSGGRGCLFWLLVPAALAFGALICLLSVVTAGLAIGVFPAQEVKAAAYNEPLDGTESAEIQLEIAVGQIIVGAASDSNDLFDADLTYIGEIEYNVSGSRDKVISLTQRGDVSSPQWVVFGVNLDFFNRSGDVTWRIGLSREVPLRLDISGGVGSLDLDLTALQIDELDMAVGVGGSHIRLPEPAENYQVTISGGVGSTEITLPRDVAVRIEASVGVGEVNMPDYLNRVSGERDFVGSDGVWETDGFDQADARIVIRYEGGVGRFTVR
jgi:hypothetical protein